MIWKWADRPVVAYPPTPEAKCSSSAFLTGIDEAIWVNIEDGFNGANVRQIFLFKGFCTQLISVAEGKIKAQGPAVLTPKVFLGMSYKQAVIGQILSTFEKHSSVRLVTDDYMSIICKLPPVLSQPAKNLYKKSLEKWLYDNSKPAQLNNVDSSKPVLNIHNLNMDTMYASVTGTLALTNDVISVHGMSKAWPGTLLTKRLRYETDPRGAVKSFNWLPDEDVFDRATFM